MFSIVHIFAIEFHKRGLFHIHMLFTLAYGNKIKSPEDTNHVICAEIPDPIEQPLAYETFSKSMVDGP